MVYNIDERQQPIRDRIKDFAEKEVVPVALEYDRREEQFPHEMYKKLGDAGLVGFAMPREYGGGGYSNLEYITMIEELTYYDPPIGLMCAIPQLATYPIYTFGSEEQKKKYVPKCASGEYIVSFVLTERNAGSDASNQQTTAVIEDDHFIINGEKIFIMHGDVSHLAVLFCKIADEKETRTRVSSIIVETATPGWNRRTKWSAADSTERSRIVATLRAITGAHFSSPLPRKYGVTRARLRLCSEPSIWSIDRPKTGSRLCS